MARIDSGAGIARQHVIDPEICIRCNTCEATCPVDAILPPQNHDPARRKTHEAKFRVYAKDNRHGPR